MSRPAKLLLVDGPLKGQVVDYPPHGVVQYVDPGDTPPVPGELPMIPDGAEWTLGQYRVVKFTLFGHLVYVGTSLPMPPPNAPERLGFPSDEVMWLAATTPEIRACAVELPRYRCAHQMADRPCPMGCHES